MELLAHVFAAALLVNCVPHLVQGLSGHPFPTPFAMPRGVGLSRPETNVLWGAANATAGCALLAVGELRFGANLDTALICSGALMVGLAISRSATRAHSRRVDDTG